MRILCTRNIGKQEKGIPPMLEGHVYDVDEALAEVMFKRGLAAEPPSSAAKAEKPPPPTTAPAPATAPKAEAPKAESIGFEHEEKKKSR